jgi:hypothetical protein
MDDGATGLGAVFKGEVVSDAGAIFRGGVDFGTKKIDIAGKAEFTKSGTFGATEGGTRANAIKIGQAAFNYGKYTGIDNMILGNGKVLFNAADGKTVSIDMASGASLNYTDTDKDTNLILSGESGKISNALVTLNSGGTLTVEAQHGKLTFEEDDKTFILESEVGGGCFIITGDSAVTLGKGKLEGLVGSGGGTASVKASGDIKFNIAYGDTLKIKNAALDISEDSESDSDSDSESDSESEIVFNGTPVDGTYSFIDLTENGHIYTTGGTASAGFIVAGINTANPSTLTIISGTEGAGSLGFINYVGDSNRIKNYSPFSEQPIETPSAVEGVASANSATSDEYMVIAVFAEKGSNQ